MFTFYCYRGNCLYHPRPIYPLFHAGSPVVDIHNGSVDVLQFHLKKSSVSFVMYYAHWCAQSKKAVYEFHRTSKIFKGQVCKG